MNQIAERTERPAKAALVAGGSVAAIVPQSIEECFRLSEAISMSGMAPYGLDTPQKVMIAMMSGLELGMPPMMAVQSIAVINNRPCMWGDALIGVVRSGTVCTYVKEWIEGDGDSRIAYCETLRKGEAEPVRRQFSVDDAKRAGLWQTQARVTKQGKNGSYEKDNDSPWYRYPQRMLQMRARAWCLRDVYPDILKGMQVREEVEDYQHVGPDNARDVTPKPSIMERLRANAPHSPAGEREGFSASSVHRQTESVLTGEIESDEPHDPDTGELSPNEASAPASPQAGPDDDGTTSAPSPADEAPSEPAGRFATEPAGSDLFGKVNFDAAELVDLKDLARKALDDAAGHSDTPAKEAAVAKLFDSYDDAINSREGRSAMAAMSKPINAVTDGKRTRQQAANYIAIELLGCDPSELEGRK